MIVYSHAVASTSISSGASGPHATKACLDHKESNLDKTLKEYSLREDLIIDL